MTKIQKIIYLLLVSCISYLLSFPVLAAEVYFETQSKEPGIDKNFEVKVLINTERESVNAVEGEIVFSSNALSVQEINDGGSFVSLWIKKPYFDGDSISFSGIMPGGYEGKEAYLFSFILKGREAAETTIGAKNMRVLRNEPPGSPAQVRISFLKLEIKQESPEPEFSIPEDKTPPEPFIPQIARNINIFAGRWFLVFAAQDKGSGVDYYTVRETRRQTESENEKSWITAESPYVLKDQKLKSYIYVKAVDKAENERIITLPPRYPLAWYENYLICIIIIAGGIVGYIIWRILWRKFHIKK